MAITISMGIGLSYINKSKQSVTDEQFLLQVSMTIDDVLNILKNSKDLESVNNSTTFRLFLDQVSFMVFERNGIKVVLEISSARSKINPNIFYNEERLNIFKVFLSNKMVNIDYADMLYDSINGIKEDASYKTDIFIYNKYLFRDYIASYEHLEKIDRIYKNKYHDNSVEKLNTKELFYIINDKNSSIDLNYATPEAWEIMLGCYEDRAVELYSNAGSYEALSDIQLTPYEESMIAKFNTSFYEPYLDVKIELLQNEKKANIRFEYNLQEKRGSNFVIKI